ncbi:MAG: restriction endonuclease subunit S [Anaerolineaceae bacterium]|nr:restriction endonuclease subunit S [Anaerolineaceae bacterium]
MSTGEKGGSTRQAITKTQIQDFCVSYPPIEEQRRIVAMLDEALAGVQQATANTERNLANTQELFDAHLQAIFANPADGWEEKTLKEIVSEMITGPFGSMLHKSDYVDDGIPVINPQNIVDGKIISLAKTMISRETKKRLSKYSLRERDLVVARRGEMGRCAIVTKDQEGWLCGTGSLVIRFKEYVDEQYLNLFLSSPISKSVLEENSSGTTMNNLSQGVLKQMQVPMPPLDEQRAIVAQLDALAAETQRLQAIYQQKLAALQELKQAILQQAFTPSTKVRRTSEVRRT